MRFFFLSLCFLLIHNTCLAQKEISRVTMPIEVSSEVKSSPNAIGNFDKLVWNRWTSKNFVVCSLDDTQAKYLNEHLEYIKTWSLQRWGIKDIDFSVPCKLVCVDDLVLFQKLFGISSTKVEIRRDQLGTIKETVIFLLIDGKPSETVPMPLMEVAMRELEQAHKDKFGIWAIKGMSLLNGTIDQIKGKIEFISKKIDSDEGVYYVQTLLMMDEREYNGLPKERKEIFDAMSMIFCLMLRHTFGEDEYGLFLKASSRASDKEEPVKKILRFADFNALNYSLFRYTNDMVQAVKTNMVPDTYLQISPAN